MSNHAQRFYDAVAVMTGHGNIKQRLIKAFEENLAAIEEHDLPIAVRESFSALREKLSEVAPLNGEGCVRASVRKMSVSDADACGRRMLEIYRDIMRIGEDAGEPVAISVGEKTVVPPFLVKSV